MANPALTQVFQKDRVFVRFNRCQGITGFFNNLSVLCISVWVVYVNQTQAVYQPQHAHSSPTGISSST